jgi:cyclophilin family peptidyl-prolyl cis-trans isomerase
MTRFVWFVAAAAAFGAGSVQAQDQKAPAPANPVVVIETSMGTITAELDKAKAPVTVENFLGYVKDGLYDGTIFHRVMPGFMIQGGGFTPDMRQKPTKPPIQNEATNGLKNTRGTLAMARTSEVRSATAQFFINTVDNDFLNHRSLNPAEFGYAVFGRVTAGMDVVQKIEKVQTTTKSGHQNVPVEAVVIKTIRVKQ